MSGWRSSLRAPTSARTERRKGERASPPRSFRRALAGIPLAALLVAGGVFGGPASSAIVTEPEPSGAARSTCGGIAVDIVGTPDADRLRGDGVTNGILGLGGQDRLFGAQNRDGLCGGVGPDVLSGGRGRDKLVGGPGADVLKGGLAADKLIGGPGADVCVGGSGPGNDRLRGC